MNVPNWKAVDSGNNRPQAELIFFLPQTYSCFSLLPLREGFHACLLAPARNFRVPPGPRIPLSTLATSTTSWSPNLVSLSPQIPFSFSPAPPSPSPYSSSLPWTANGLLIPSSLPSPSNPDLLFPLFESLSQLPTACRIKSELLAWSRGPPQPPQNSWVGLQPLLLEKHTPYILVELHYCSW